MLHPESIRQSPSGGIRLPESSSKHRFAHSGHRFTLAAALQHVRLARRPKAKHFVLSTFRAGQLDFLGAHLARIEMEHAAPCLDPFHTLRHWH